jgi:hypothetical protein
MRVIEIKQKPVRVYSPDCKRIQKITVYVDKESFSVEQEAKIIEFFKNL